MKLRQWRILFLLELELSSTRWTFFSHSYTHSLIHSLFLFLSSPVRFYFLSIPFFFFLNNYYLCTMHTYDSSKWRSNTYPLLHQWRRSHSIYCPHLFLPLFDGNPLPYDVTYDVQFFFHIVFLDLSGWKEFIIFGIHMNNFWNMYIYMDIQKNKL